MPRRRAWADQIITVTLTAAGHFEDLLATAPVLDTITATRIIGRLFATTASLTAQVDSGQRLDMGICVVDASAFAAGLTALPDPRVSGDSSPRGWLWRSAMFPVKVHSTDATFEVANFDTIEFDVGAMRKVDKGKLVMIVYRTAFAGNAVDVDLEGLIRTLSLT